MTGAVGEPESVGFFFFFFVLSLSLSAGLPFDESSSDRSSPGLPVELELTELSDGLLVAADVVGFFLISALLLCVTKNVDVMTPSEPNHNFLQFGLTIPSLQKGDYIPAQTVPRRRLYRIHCIY